MRIPALLLALSATILPALPAQADVLLAARTLRAGTLVEPGDVILTTDPAPLGAAQAIDEAVGYEARVTLYAGRPIRLEDIGPPALVERNERVLLRYVRGALRITAEGRALDRGAEGDWIRAINLSSRQTISGRVAADGVVEVSP